MQANPPIRVLVVDDSAVFRKMLKLEIEKLPDFEITGTAADGRAAIEMVRQLKPDIVTLDVEMPVLSGIDALRVIVKESNASVIMVSSQTESGAKVTLDALDLGAIDFIAKTRGSQSIGEKLLAAAHVVGQRKGKARDHSALHRLAAPVPPPGRLRRDIRLIVIGSSTGGPQALQTLLPMLPPNLAVPVVIAQHMPPGFTETLAKRLDQICKLRVVHASDGTKLVPGTIYIGPGGSTMRVNRTEICISSRDEGSLYKPSVDLLAASAAAAFGKQVLGVMLTGMGADGTKEFVALRQLGAYTIAQDQASSVVFGMPKSLIDASGADDILPVTEIAKRIAQLLDNSPARMLGVR